MFEAERDRARQIRREKALKTELIESEESERRAEIKVEDHVQFLGEKLQKLKESCIKDEAEVRNMEINTNKSLEELSVDLVRFHLKENLYVLLRDLIGQFSKIRGN